RPESFVCAWRCLLRKLTGWGTVRRPVRRAAESLLHLVGSLPPPRLAKPPGTRRVALFVGVGGRAHASRPTRRSGRDSSDRLVVRAVQGEEGTGRGAGSAENGGSVN